MNSKSVKALGARRTLMATSAIWSVCAGLAWGQAATPVASPDGAKGNTVEEVIVTGTQIRGVAPVGSQVISVGQEQIKESGFQTTDDVIRSLPQISNLGGNELVTNSATNNATLNVARANGINLRGLGPQATLVLVDGHRPAPEGVGAQLFDPSAIPTLAVSRLEVVADGASALYGADAVAGVVNVILRKNFDGLEASADGIIGKDYYGNREGAIFGKTFDKGSFMIAGEYYFHSALQASERPNLYNSNQTAYGGRDQDVFASVPGNICPGNSCSLSAVPSAMEFGIPAGQSGVGLTAGQLSTTPNRLSAFNNISILPAIDRVSGVTAFNYHPIPNLNVRVEGFYTDDSYKEFVGDLTKSVTIPSTNPYYVAPAPGTPLVANTPCSPAVGAPAGALCESVAYDFSKDLGPTVRRGHEVNYQIDAGADYDLPHQFRLAADFVYGRDIIYDFSQALSSSAVTAAVLGSTPATALNVFGQGGSNSAAVLAPLLGYSLNRSFYDSKLYSVRLDGPLFGLPGGDVRIAVGGEIRQDNLTGYAIGNAKTASTSVIQYNNGPSYDSRTVKSVYGELFIPIVGSGNALPFVQRLEFDVAGRYDDYSDFGGTTNPKFSVRYDPITDLTIHGNYGTSFRAPTLSDKDPSSTATAFYDNPNFASCACHSIDIVGGNPNIKPETAKTFSIGGDYRPHWAPGLDLNLTYFHIDYKNIIDTPGSLNPLVLTNPLYSFLVRKVSPMTNAADLAYVQSILSTPYYASSAALPAASYNLVIDGQRVNVGESLTSGFDIQVGYAWEAWRNRFNIGFSGEYLTQYDYSLIAGAPFVSQLNNINFPLRFKGRGALGWGRGDWRVNGFINYVNGYTDNIAPLGATGLGTMAVSPYVTFDLTVGYNGVDLPGLAKGLSFSVNALNLFDTDPPRALTGTYIYDSTVGNPIGRQVSIEIRKKF